MSEGRASLVAGMPVTPSVQLLAPLGAGGMGAVWLADHTALKTRVVVKFMLGGLDANAAAVKRFKREAEAAAAVKSPHVVQMLDHGVTEDGVPFIVMEHLEGRDLGEVLEEAKGPLEPRRVITIVTQVAKALTKVHAAGLLHRDIKPDNIFLCDGEDDDYVKLLDFGIAKSADPQQRDATLDGETKTGQIVGTPFYMSPEQVTAQKVIDARSDLWALGVVTFEALTGQRPFDGPSFGALAVKIATGSPPRPSEVNPALPPTFDAWFEKACAREADGRFKSARELADALRAAFEGYVSLPPSARMSDSSGERQVSRRAPTPTELASTAVAVTGAENKRAGAVKIALGVTGAAVVAVGAVVVGMKTAPEPPPRPPAAVLAAPPVTASQAEPIASVAPSESPAASASAPAPASAPASASASAASPSAHVAPKPPPIAARPPPASASAPAPPSASSSAKPPIKPSTTAEPDLY